MKGENFMCCNNYGLVISKDKKKKLMEMILAGQEAFVAGFLMGKLEPYMDEEKLDIPAGDAPAETPEPAEPSVPATEPVDESTPAEV